MVKMIPQRVRTILKETRQELQNIYQDRLKEVILYGSYARGDFMDDSDIDIILLLEGVKDISAERDRYLPITGRLSLKHDTVISVIPFDVKVFHKQRTPLILNVNREGIRL